MSLLSKLLINRFNTQPPEGGWVYVWCDTNTGNVVSTHSRLKAAGVCKCLYAIIECVSTHSRLKAAGIDFKD